MSQTASYTRRALIRNPLLLLGAAGAVSLLANQAVTPPSSQAQKTVSASKTPPVYHENPANLLAGHGIRF